MDEFHGKVKVVVAENKRAFHFKTSPLLLDRDFVLISNQPCFALLSIPISEAALKTDRKTTTTHTELSDCTYMYLLQDSDTTMTNRRRTMNSRVTLQTYITQYVLQQINVCYCTYTLGVS